MAYLCLQQVRKNENPSFLDGFADYRPPLDWPWTTGKAIKTMVFAEGRALRQSRLRGK